MKTKLIEGTNRKRGINFGKFLVGVFDEEWSRESVVDPGRSLLGRCGWTESHIHVLDLQTGEGAIFSPHGLAVADLNKHRIWVCPMFEPFLIWLYQQDLSDLSKLPDHVDLDAEGEMYGYRREGPKDDEKFPKEFRGFSE